MKKRNEFLEIDGLAFESETHEWFNDKSTTHYAQKEDVNGIALPDIFCFVVYTKTTGDYNRVIMNKKHNNIVYDTKNLEDLGFWIDQQKLLINLDKQDDKK